MADEIASRATLVDYVRGEAKLVAYAGSSEAAITQALAAGNGEGLAALKRSGKYATTAVSALTAATAPADLRDAVNSRALHHLTKSGGTRPDIISEAAEDAFRTLKLIAEGKYIVEGITIASTSVDAGGVSHHRESVRVFDRVDTLSAFNIRDEAL